MNRIDNAFEAVERQNFLPSEQVELAEVDAPLPIGYGQTNSQPSTVRLMLNWLDPLKGQKILDVGSGSGWTTALLSNLVGPKGKVYAVEKVEDLVMFGEENCERIGINNAKFFKAGKRPGLPKHAPYDRILVSAAAQKLPDKLVDQLKIGGRLVIPIKRSVYVIDRVGKTETDVEEYPGFVFVPLI